MGKWVGLSALLCLNLYAYPNNGANRCDFVTPVAGKIRTASVDPVATKARAIFNVNCAVCHGKGATAGAGIMNDILDRDDLVKNAFVDLANPPNSRIFLAINRAVRQMPLGKPPLSLSDKTAILDWIKGGAVQWDAPVVLNPGQISYQQVIGCIQQDAEALDYKKKGDAQNYRYFDLSNLYNTGVPDKFKNVGYALDKALNQTAFGPVRITNSKKLDAAGVVRRIDLRDYAYSQNDWDVLLLDRYPFAIDFSKGNYYTRQQIDYIVKDEDDIERFTGSPRAWIRADFFVDQALGPLYYTLLFDKGQADNLQQLERTLGVNANAAIADFEVNVSAIRRSGVSVWNREIHRYDSTYNVMGVKTDTSYWKTFDVINEVAQRNFFAFPLGPQGVQFNFKTAKVFQFDAGEEIFGLPNGLEGFFIADKNGVRLQEAAIAVAVDRDNNSPFIGSAPGVVQVGVSCNHCHGGGVNSFQDQLLYHSEHTSGFNSAEVNAINQLFPVQAVWNTAFTSYNTAFLASHQLVVNDPLAVTSTGEPTWNADRTFQDYQSVEDAAGEFGLTADEFKDCLFHSPGLAQELGLSETALGHVAREALDDDFGRVADECGLGEQIIFKKRRPVKPPPIVTPPPIVKPPPNKCRFSIENQRYNALLIRIGSPNANIIRIEPGRVYEGDGNTDVWYLKNNQWVKTHVECKVYRWAEGA